MNKILRRKKEIDNRSILLFLVFIIFDISIMVIDSFPQTASEDTKNKDKKSLHASFQIKNYSENIAWKKWIIRSGASFSPDGKLIAIPAGFGSIQLISTSDYKIIKIINTNDDADMEKAFFSSNGKFVSGIAQNEYVYTWDLSDGHQVSRVKLAEDCMKDVSKIGISSNAMLAAFPCQEGTIHLWNMKDGKFIGELKTNRFPIELITFSNDGKIMASSDDKTNLDIWDIAQQQLLQSISAPEDDIAAVALSPGGRFAAIVSPDITIWRVSDGSLIKKLAMPREDGNTGRRPIALAFSPDEKLIISGELIFAVKDGTGDNGSNLMIWDIDKEQSVQSVSWPENGIEGIEFSPDGKSIMTEAFNDVRLFQIPQGIMVKHFRGYGSDNEFVEYSSDGKYLLNAGGSKVISFWRSADGNLEKEIDSIGFPQLSPDGKYICTWEDLGEGGGAYYLYRVDDGERIHKVDDTDEDCGIHDTAFSKDSSMLATSGDCDSKIISLETDELNVIVEHTHAVSAFTFSSVCCISAWGSLNGKIYMYNTKLGKFIKSWEAHDNEIGWLNFFQDGKILVTMDNENGTLRSWKIPEAIKIDEYNQTDSVRAWTVSSNRQVAAFYSKDSSSLTFLKLNPLKRISQWKAQGKIDAMKLSPEGDLIAITYNSNPVMFLYSVADGSLVGELKGHRAKISAFDFSPDNKYLAAASSDGIIVWNVRGSGL